MDIGKAPKHINVCLLNVCLLNVCLLVAAFLLLVAPAHAQSASISYNAHITVVNNNTISVSPLGGEPTFQCTAAPYVQFVNMIVNEDTTTDSASNYVLQGGGASYSGTGQQSDTLGYTFTLNSTVATTWTISQNLYLYGTSQYSSNSFTVSHDAQGWHGLTACDPSVSTCGNLTASGPGVTSTGTGGSGGTGSTGSTGSTSGGFPSFDSLTSWVQSLFTMDSAHQQDWQTFIQQWQSMGPWGQIKDINTQLSSQNAYGPTQAITYFNYTEHGARSTVTDDQSTDPVYPMQQMPLPGADFTINGDVAGASTAGDPWTGAGSLYTWRGAFRQILQWSFWVLFGVGMVQWLKGRFIV